MTLYHDSACQKYPRVQRKSLGQSVPLLKGREIIRVCQRTAEWFFLSFREKENQIKLKDLYEEQ